MSYVLILIAVWLTSLVIWWLVSSAFRSADVDKIKSRLVGTAKQKKSKGERRAPRLIQPEDQKTGRMVMRLLNKMRLNERLGTLIEQAGLKWHPARTVHACLALFLMVFWIGWSLLPGDLRLAALLLGAGAGSLPILYVLNKRKGRLRKFEEQFPESLEFVSRSMRAGHAFSVSLEMIHREFQEPLAGEFRRTFEEHNLGLPMDVALEKLAKRVPSMDVHFFVAAVLLQKRTGGNLAEILDKLAYVIRERFKLRGRIRAISAHGRMTGGALTCIPIAVAVIMFYVNPEYVRFFFTDPTGQVMLAITVGLQILGYAIIKKIVQIEV